MARPAALVVGGMFGTAVLALLLFAVAPSWPGSMGGLLCSTRVSRNLFALSVDVARVLGGDWQTRLVRLTGDEAWPLSAEEVLVTQLDVARSPAPFLLVTGGPGPAAPTRRATGQPFVQATEPGLLGEPLLEALNEGAIALESALGRRLFPLSFGTFAAPDAPYAIWEVSTGRVLLRASRKQEPGGWASSEAARGPQVQALVTQLARHTFAQLRQLVAQQGASLSLTLPSLSTLLSASAGAAIPLAFAALLAAGPPLWFCILCPSVLGLAAPIAINLALNQLAGLLCSRMQLDDAGCFDILVGALAVGFVLSLASAVPIFVVCQMAACAHGRKTSIAAAGGSLVGSLAGRGGGSSWIFRW